MNPNAFRVLSPVVRHNQVRVEPRLVQRPELFVEDARIKRMVNGREVDDPIRPFRTDGRNTRAFVFLGPIHSA
jgi:hypothetical protein